MAAIAACWNFNVGWNFRGRQSESAQRNVNHCRRAAVESDDTGGIDAMSDGNCPNDEESEYPGGGEDSDIG